MMAERDLVAAFLDGDVVQNSATQPRTDRTIRLAFRDQSLDDRIRIAFDDAKRNVELAEICGQHFSRKSRLFLVEIHGQQVEIHWRAATDIDQKVQKCVTVFTA